MKKVLILSYFFLLIAFTVFSYVFVDANFFYLKSIYTGFATHNRFVVAFLYIIFIAAFYLLYVLFLKFIQRKILILSDIRQLVILTTVILLFAYPAMLSFDIFNYLATAKVLFFYHENPYIVMPIEFIGDPYLLYTHAANKLALYGPVWIAISGIPYFSGFGNIIAILLSFKIFIGIFYISTLFLIWKLSKNVFNLSFFALNPLVIIETFVSNHNDMVMMFFVLLSLYLLKKSKLFYSLIFFILSIAVKYSTLFLLPVYIYIIWKQKTGEKIDWQKVWIFSFFLMFFIFILSFLREEIYPWYAIWFLVFGSFLTAKKFFLFLCLSFSLGLLLRYVPFMLTGTHFESTPLIKTTVTFIPPAIVMIYLLIKRFV